MVLSQKHRTSIYSSLSPVIGEEEAEALLAQFPDRDDELVTKSYLRAELAELRTDLRGEIGDLRTELHSEVGGLRAEMHDRMRAQTAWFVGAIFAAISLAVTLSAAVR